MCHQNLVSLARNSTVNILTTNHPTNVIYIGDSFSVCSLEHEWQSELLLEILKHGFNMRSNTCIIKQELHY